MTQIVRYLSHPQVVIDPDVPVGQWGLNEVGRGRVALLAASRILAGTKSVISSAEVKATQTSEPLAASLNIPFEIHNDMHENDRSATGYLPAEAFEAHADAFFGDPLTSINGWERAIDAQSRICRAVEAALACAPVGDVLLVGHGAVGTLLWCAITGRTISRIHDQPFGGGNAFAFARDDRAALHPWTPIEALKPLR